MIFLDETFSKLWTGKDPFAEAEKLDGDIFRNVKNRRTLRFRASGNSYFLKLHRGVGWLEIFKNLLMLKMPVIGAENEYNAIRSLEKLDIATMKVAAFGKRGKNPAKQLSFIITEELINTESLEDFCREWPDNPPKFALKKALIERIATVSRRIHNQGINHRDYYICHFLLDISSGRDNINTDKLKVSLIDLHRAQIRDKAPLRWVLKDIGGIWFSAMDISLTKTDTLRFMKIYRNKPLRDTLRHDKKFWTKVHKRACRLYKKETGKIYAGYVKS